MEDAPTGKRKMDRLVAEVASRMRSGASLTEVEDTVIDPSALDSDRKAALWLYAWSCQSRKRQRRQAVEHILMLTKSGSHLA